MSGFPVVDVELFEMSISRIRSLAVIFAMSEAGPIILTSLRHCVIGSALYFYEYGFLKLKFERVWKVFDVSPELSKLTIHLETLESFVSLG